MASSLNGAWRQTGGRTRAPDSAAFDALVANTLTVRDGIQGDLNIDGTLFANKLITLSEGSAISGSLSVQDDIDAGGNVQAASVSVSGDVAVLNNLLLQHRLVLGPTVSAGARTSTATQFLWSDGVSGVALNAADAFPDAVPANRVPASLFISGANPAALVASTSAPFTRNILAQTAGKSGLAVHSATASGSVAGSTTLQFYDGGSSASRVDRPLLAAPADTAALSFQNQTLTLAAPHLRLDGSAQLFSRSTTGPATAPDDVPALVAHARPLATSGAGAAPYDEPLFPGLLRAAAAEPALPGVSAFAAAPARLAAPDNHSHAFLFAGNADGSRGWRTGGGPAFDPDTLARPDLDGRSASHAGFMEPARGGGGAALFVPVFSQTEGESRLQTRATVAVHAPLAPAAADRALLVNGPTRIQHLAAWPLSDPQLPFAPLPTPHAAWGTVALPDALYDPVANLSPGTTGGKLGVVCGGRNTDTDQYLAYVSVDAGQTWTATPFPVQTGITLPFRPHVFGPQHLFLCAPNGFAVVSTNSGAAWTNANHALDNTGDNLVPYAYVVPGAGTAPLLYCKGTTLYAYPDLLAPGGTRTAYPLAAAPLGLPATFTPLGLAGALHFLPSAPPSPVYLTLFGASISGGSPRGTLATLRVPDPFPLAGGGGPMVPALLAAPHLSALAVAFHAAAASTLLALPGAVAAAGLAANGGLVVAVSRDWGASWPQEVALPTSPANRVGFVPQSVAWLSPTTLVVLSTHFT